MMCAQNVASLNHLEDGAFVYDQPEEVVARNRDVVEKTKAEFRHKAGKETFAESAVDESLDRMAGSTQDISDARPVRDKLKRAARKLARR